MFVGYSKLLAGAAFALGLSLFGTALAAPDPNFHIYIAYGQSNMGGTADAQSADKAEHPRFKIFATQKCSGKGRNTLGEVYPAVPSLFNCGNTISIADWFGRTMADSMPDVTIGIIPVAVGGASIKLFEKTNMQVTSQRRNLGSRTMQRNTQVTETFTRPSLISRKKRNRWALSRDLFSTRAKRMAGTPIGRKS